MTALRPVNAPLGSVVSVLKSKLRYLRLDMAAKLGMAASWFWASDL